MKIIAIILNILMLVMVFLMLADEGVPHRLETWLIFMIVGVTPIFNLIAFYYAKGDSWMSLYFKRKAMEEKKKIEQLSGDNN